MIPIRFAIGVTVFFFFAASTGFSQEAVDQNWPSWRGPANNGSGSGAPPIQWSSDENLKWKIAIPGRGFSTPIVWGNKVFITTAVPTEPTPEPTPRPARVPGQRRRGGMRGGPPPVEHTFDLICLDRDSGDVLWRNAAATSTPHQGHHRQYGSFASGSPVTDGEHVYAFYNSRGLFCYDMEGALVWVRDFGVQMNITGSFGEGSSPAIHGDTIVVVFDHAGDSFIEALDKRTGKKIWSVQRPDHRAWPTPLIAEVNGRPQAILGGNIAAHGYDLLTGEVTWTAGGGGRGNVIASAVSDHGLVFLKIGSGLQAHRIEAMMGAEGDASLAWSPESPMGGNSPSPMILGDEVYTLRSNGVISCYDARTGRVHYEGQRLPVPAQFKSSPVGAKGRIYLSSETGQVIVLKSGPQFEMLAVNEMGEMLVASPAVAGDDLFIRGLTMLSCISEIEG